MAKKKTTRRGKTPAKPKATPKRSVRGVARRGMSLEDVAHMAITRMVCDGFYSQVFRLPMFKLVAFGRYLLTPKSESSSLCVWLKRETGTKINEKVIYRYAAKFRLAAYAVVRESMTAPRPRK